MIHTFRRLVLTSLPLAGILLASCQSGKQNQTVSSTKNAMENDVKTVTILQTADIHGQVEPHQEFFVENGKFVFKKRGGLAHIQTIFKQIKAENLG